MYATKAPRMETAVITGQSLPAQPSRLYAMPTVPRRRKAIWAYTSFCEILPEGMGRYGSLIASRSRSYLQRGTSVAVRQWGGGGHGLGAVAVEAAMSTSR